MRVFFLFLFSWMDNIASRTLDQNMLTETVGQKASYTPRHADELKWDQIIRSKNDAGVRRKARQLLALRRTAEPGQRRNARHRREAPAQAGASMTAMINGVPVQLSPVPAGSDAAAALDFSGMSATSGSAEGLSGQLVAEDQAGNVAASLAELELPGRGVTGPIYELVGAGVKLQPPRARPAPTTPPPPRGGPTGNASAVGEVLVNIQHADQKQHGQRKQRHWCDLAGVWINDEGSLLLTLGFPAAAKTVISGYLSQVSVDMTPKDRRRRRRRRRRREAERLYRRAAPPPPPVTEVTADPPPPHYQVPPAGASGLPSSLTNRTALHGSAVSRAGPFALATRHSGSAVGSLVGQCQTCGGLDTIVAHVFAVSEVFTCLDAMWNQKTVRVMFRKWGERHRRRHHLPLALQTEVVIKQRDRGPQRPPPPPPQETLELSEEIVSTYRRRRR